MFYFCSRHQISTLNTKFLRNPIPTKRSPTDVNKIPLDMGTWPCLRRSLSRSSYICLQDSLSTQRFGTEESGISKACGNHTPVIYKFPPRRKKEMCLLIHNGSMFGAFILREWRCIIRGWGLVNVLEGTRLSCAGTFGTRCLAEFLRNLNPRP